jgi:membrane protease YdiL (CAAX protease family)
MLSLPSACLMMTVATASEDSLYRGYALKMLQARYGTTAAVAITTAFYAMLAGIQGWPLMLWALYFGLILSLIRLWRNNLWPVFLTHLLTSIAPRLLDLF